MVQWLRLELECWKQEFHPLLGNQTQCSQFFFFFKERNMLRNEIVYVRFESYGIQNFPTPSGSDLTRRKSPSHPGPFPGALIADPAFSGHNTGDLDLGLDGTPVLRFSHNLMLQTAWGGGGLGVLFRRQGQYLLKWEVGRDRNPARFPPALTQQSRQGILVFQELTPMDNAAELCLDLLEWF